MLPEFMQNLITLVADNALLLGLVLALATLISEDASLLTGALLVGTDTASAPVVIASLVLGILGGDIGLYGLGFWARQNLWLRKRIPLKTANRFKTWLAGREAAVLFTSRFLPGTRLPTYVSFGYLRLSLLRFTLVMAAAALVWVGGSVLLISEIQALLMDIDPTFGIALGVLAAVMFIFIVPNYLRRHQKLQAFQADSIESDPDARQATAAE